MPLGDLVAMLDDGFGRRVVKVNFKGEIFDVPSEAYYHHQHDMVSLWLVEEDVLDGTRTLVIKR